MAKPLRTRTRKPADPPYPPTFDAQRRDDAVTCLTRIKELLYSFEQRSDVYSYVDWSKLRDHLEVTIRDLRDGLEVDE